MNTTRSAVRAMAPVGQAYDRTRDLPRLVPVWPAEVADGSVAGAEALIARVVRALRAERRRGLAREWSYDLGRHRSLAAALTFERQRLGELREAERRAASRSRRRSRQDREAVNNITAHIVS